MHCLASAGPELFVFLLWLALVAEAGGASENVETISKQFTFGKYERLKSLTLIKELFSEGASFSIFPLKVFYLRSENLFTSPPHQSPQKPGIYLQAGVGVSSRQFKRAVDRNRIKRLMREAYRLQKNQLQKKLEKNNQRLALFLIYTGRELPSYNIIFDKTSLILHRLSMGMS